MVVKARGYESPTRVSLSRKSIDKNEVWKEKHKAAVNIQRSFRGWRARRRIFQEMWTAAYTALVLIQAWWRGSLVRKKTQARLPTQSAGAVSDNPGAPYNKKSDRWYFSDAWRRIETGSATFYDKAELWRVIIDLRRSQDPADDGSSSGVSNAEAWTALLTAGGAPNGAAILLASEDYLYGMRKCIQSIPRNLVPIDKKGHNRHRSAFDTQCEENRDVSTERIINDDATSREANSSCTDGALRTVRDIFYGSSRDWSAVKPKKRGRSSAPRTGAVTTESLPTVPQVMDIHDSTTPDTVFGTHVKGGVRFPPHLLSKPSTKIISPPNTRGSQSPDRGSARTRPLSSNRNSHAVSSAQKLVSHAVPVVISSGSTLVPENDVSGIDALFSALEEAEAGMIKATASPSAVVISPIVSPRVVDLATPRSISPRPQSKASIHTSPWK